MNRNVKPNLKLLAVAIAALLFSATASADGPAKKLPLSAFLDTQGSQVNYIPPVADTGMDCTRTRGENARAVLGLHRRQQRLLRLRGYRERVAHGKRLPGPRHLILRFGHHARAERWPHAGAGRAAHR